MKITRQQKGAYALGVGIFLGLAAVAVWQERQVRPDRDSLCVGEPATTTVVLLDETDDLAPVTREEIASRVLTPLVSGQRVVVYSIDADTLGQWKPHFNKCKPDTNVSELVSARVLVQRRAKQLFDDQIRELLRHPVPGAQKSPIAEAIAALSHTRWLHPPTDGRTAERESYAAKLLIVSDFNQYTSQGSVLTCEGLEPLKSALVVQKQGADLAGIDVELHMIPRPGVSVASAKCRDDFWTWFLGEKTWRQKKMLPGLISDGSVGRVSTRGPLASQPPVSSSERPLLRAAGTLDNIESSTGMAATASTRLEAIVPQPESTSRCDNALVPRDLWGRLSDRAVNYVCRGGEVPGDVDAWEGEDLVRLLELKAKGLDQTTNADRLEYDAIMSRHRRRVDGRTAASKETVVEGVATVPESAVSGGLVSGKREVKIALPKVVVFRLRDDLRGNTPDVIVNDTVVARLERGRYVWFEVGEGTTLNITSSCDGGRAGRDHDSSAGLRISAETGSVYYVELLHDPNGPCAANWRGRFSARASTKDSFAAAALQVASRSAALARNVKTQPMP